MRQELTSAFAEHLAGNLDAGGRPDYYGVRVDWAADDGSVFDLTLTFKAGERYCCAEPGCHLGLNDPECWRSLRQVFERLGLARVPPVTVRKVRGIVEPGAILGYGVASKRPVVSTGFTYEAGPYSES
jgi:hypothetical protein